MEEQFNKLLRKTPTMKFKNLKVGQKFIATPLLGNGHGHGDYPYGQGPHYIFKRIRKRKKTSKNFPDLELKVNVKRLKDGILSLMTPGMLVIRVE